MAVEVTDIKTKECAIKMGPHERLQATLKRGDATQPMSITSYSNEGTDTRYPIFHKSHILEK